MGSISLEQSIQLKREICDNYNIIIEQNHNYLISILTNPEFQSYDAILPTDFSTTNIQINSTNYYILFCFGHIVIKSISKNRMRRRLGLATI